MADIVRTAKGIVKAKVSGTTLTLSDVSVTAGQPIIAIVGFQGTVVPTVAAGTRDLKKVVQRVNSTLNFGAVMYYARSLKISNTRDVVATWASATTARVMAVITLDKPVVIFEPTGNIQNSASPTTSANTLDLPVHNCFHLGAFISQGPSGDTAPTLSIDWTSGQRDGTVGPAPITNITLLEGFKVGRCIDAEEMDSSNATTRDFCNILASFKPLPEYPAMDGNGDELEEGDTVNYLGTEYTISSITRQAGEPFAFLTLGTGIVVSCHQTLLVE